MPNFKGMKLGKLKAKHDKRTLKLATYLDLSVLPAAPAMVNYGDKVPTWPMMKNDEVGCCAISGVGHRIQCMTANAGNLFVPTDQQILDAYSAVSGYDQKTGANDNGCAMLDVQRYMQQTGIGGHRWGAFVAVDPENVTMLRAALWLFGGLDVGLWMPVAWEEAEVWDVGRSQRGKWKAGTWGGHAVYSPIYALAAENEVEVVTWGGLIRLTFPAIARYADEIYASISQDWMIGAKSVSGFDAAALASDLAAVAA